MSIIKEKYFVKDGSRNCFIAESNLKDESSIFSNGEKNEETQKTLRRSVARGYTGQYACMTPVRRQFMQVVSFFLQPTTSKKLLSVSFLSAKPSKTSKMGATGPRKQIMARWVVDGSRVLKLFEQKVIINFTRKSFSCSNFYHTIDNFEQLLKNIQTDTAVA